MSLHPKLISWCALAALLALAACITPTSPPGTPLPPTPGPLETPTQTARPETATPTVPEPTPSPIETSETPTGVPETATPTGEPSGPFPPISPENAPAVEKLARVGEEGLEGFTWSTRGDWLAVVSSEGVTVYSREEIGAAVGEMPAGGNFVPVGPVNPADLFLSPGGDTLGVLLIQEFTVQLWDVDRGEMTGTLAWTEHAAPALYGVAFSPDWRNLAWYARGTLQFMDVASGALGSTVNYEEFIQAVAFSDEGEFFASATLGTVQGDFVQVVQVWDVDDGEPYATLIGHESPVTLLRFSTDGRFLAAATFDGDVAVWQLAQRQLLQVVGGYSTGVQEIAFTGDGQYLVVVSPDGSARYWDLASGEELLSWQGMQAAISPDGRVLAFQSSAGDMMLIDPSSGEELRGLETPASLSLLKFSPEGRFLTGLSPEEPALHLWGVPQ
jgi:WD40 repeat protein